MQTQTNIASNSAAFPLEVLMNSFSFPAASHPANETFCADHFAQVVARKGELKTLKELRFEARDWIVGVQSYCLLADDSIALVYCGPRGGKKIIWNFGA